ncbi:putative transcription repressor PLATZ family [Helianthus anomalus]
MNPNKGDGVWWLSSFLATTFFLKCEAHPGDRNHRNKYCTECETAACQYCNAQETHNDHKVLTINKLSGKAVVSLNQMSDYIDCSRIQTYASNGKQMLALHPLPHNNSGQFDPDRACRTCTRVLMNPDRYSYCSIVCKPFIKRDAAVKGDGKSRSRSGDGGKGGGGGAAGTRSKRSSLRVRMRKGVSHRSPLF